MQPLEVVAQAESTRSYFLAQTLESTRTVPMVSANLPLDTAVVDGPETPSGSNGEEAESGEGSDEPDPSGIIADDSTVVGSFVYRGITYAVEPGGESVAIVAVDYAKLPQEFIEAHAIVLPSRVSADDIDFYSVTRIADGAFAGMAEGAAFAAQDGQDAEASSPIWAQDESRTHEDAPAMVSNAVELAAEDSVTDIVSTDDVSSRMASSSSSSVDVGLALRDGEGAPQDDTRTSGDSSSKSESSEPHVVLTGGEEANDAGEITIITVPESITTIEDGAFSGFETLQFVVVSPDSLSFSSYDGCLYNADRTNLLLIPEGRLGAVRIPSTVTTISEDVSSHCAHLTSFVVEADSAASQLLKENDFYNAEGEKIEVIAASSDDEPIIFDYYAIVQDASVQPANEAGLVQDDASGNDAGSLSAIEEMVDIQDEVDLMEAEIIEGTALKSSADAIDAPTSGALPLKGNLSNTDQNAAGWSFDVSTGLLSIWSSGTNTVQAGLAFNDAEGWANKFWGPWRSLVTAVDTTRLSGAVNMSAWFCGMSRLSDISKLIIPDGTKGDAPTSFDEAFVNCRSLTEIPSTFKFSNNAKSFVSMFWGCSNLSKLYEGFNLPSFPGAITFASMFYNCKSLTRLPASLILNRSPYGDIVAQAFSWSAGGSSADPITTYYPGDLSRLAPAGTDPVAYWKTQYNRTLIATAGALPTIANASNTNTAVAGWTFDLDSGLLTIKSAASQTVNIPWGWGTSAMTTLCWGPLRSQVKAVDTRELSGARSWSAWFASMPNLSDISRLIIPNGSRGGEAPINFQECFVGDGKIKAIPSTFVLPNNAYIFAAMFYGCSGLETIYEGFTIPTASASIEVNTMFYSCSSLTELPSSLSLSASNFIHTNTTFSGAGTWMTREPIVTYTNNLLSNMAPAGQDPVEYWKTNYNRTLVALRGALPTKANAANSDPAIAGWKFDRSSGLLTISSAVSQSASLGWSWSNQAVFRSTHWGPLRSQVKAIDTRSLSGAAAMDAWFALMPNLSDLSRFVIPDGSKGAAPTSFGETFVNCSSITTLPSNVVFPPATTHMGSTFWGCANLSSIYEGFTFPRGVSTLNLGTTFYGCTSLVRLPASLDLSASNLYGVASGVFNFAQGASVVSPLTTYYTGDLSKLAPAGQDPVQFWLEKYNRTLVPLAGKQAAFVVRPIGKNVGWEPFGNPVAAASSGLITRPATDPYTYGYPFLGWFTDATCTTEFDFTRAITGPTVLYGKFGGPIFNATVPLGTGEANFVIDRAYRNVKALIDGELESTVPLRVESRTPVKTVLSAATSLDAEKAELLFSEGAENVQLVIYLTEEGDVRIGLDGGENDSVAVLEGATEDNQVVALDGGFTLNLNGAIPANRDGEEALEDVANIIWTVSMP